MLLEYCEDLELLVFTLTTSLVYFMHDLYLVLHVVLNSRHPCYNIFSELE